MTEEKSGVILHFGMRIFALLFELEIVLWFLDCGFLYGDPINRTPAWLYRMSLEQIDWSVTKYRQCKPVLRRLWKSKYIEVRCT